MYRGNPIFSLWKTTFFCISACQHSPFNKYRLSQKNKKYIKKNVDLNFLLSLAAYFIHMANILGIVSFRSWCMRRITTHIRIVFPDVFVQKGTAVIVTVVSSVFDSTLCQTLECSVSFVIFPTWQSGPLALRYRAL